MDNNKTKIRSVRQKCVWSLSTLGAVIGIAIATLWISPANAQGTQNLQFDVFIDANTIYFSGPPRAQPRHHLYRDRIHLSGRHACRESSSSPAESDWRVDLPWNVHAQCFRGASRGLHHSGILPSR